jgi:hypothetical protein
VIGGAATGGLARGANSDLGPLDSIGIIGVLCGSFCSAGRYLALDVDALIYP